MKSIDTERSLGDDSNLIHKSLARSLSFSKGGRGKGQEHDFIKWIDSISTSIQQYCSHGIGGQSMDQISGSTYNA